MTYHKMRFALLAVFLMGLSDLQLTARSRETGAAKPFSIHNKTVQLTFDGVSGVLMEFKNLTTGMDLTSGGNHPGSPWEITLKEDAGPRQVDVFKARSFQYIKPDNRTAILEWADFPGARFRALKVRVVVSLDSAAPFSQWSIALEGTKGLKMTEVAFPKLYNLNKALCGKFVAPQWMGELIENPLEELSRRGNKTLSLDYPGVMSMQFEALYNDQGHGIYLASDDTLNYSKQFSVYTDSLHEMNFRVVNYPALDPAMAEYAPSYRIIVGSFRGDWMDAAFIYRKWAIKQSWVRNSRMLRAKDRSWIDSTAVWIWNRGESSNVLTPAEDLKQKLGLPVSVLWHWWHGCAYDDGFPDYLPPREGSASFKEAVSRARKKDIHEVVYMNSFQWGTHNEDYKTMDASRWAVKDLSGDTRAHVFNIFTHHSLTPMCMGTDFWRHFYDSIAVKAIEEYKVSGIYMDQACINLKCYDQTHDHTTGGGNYWVNGFGLLTHSIREDTRAEEHTVLTGEGCSENWLPLLDGLLTLQVSQERYAGVGGSEVIPLFQSVYHPYGVTFGSYSSLVSPPYDNLWPKANAPKDPESLLPAEFNQQFLMEQARSFVWGLEPTIANYHPFLTDKRTEETDFFIDLARIRYQTLKFLLHGRLVRAPSTRVAEKTIPISRLSIYAGQGERVNTFHKKVPLLYYAAWKSDDGLLGIPVASISDTSMRVKFAFKSGDYDLPMDGTVYMIDKSGRKVLTRFSGGRINIDFALPSRGICFLEFTPGQS